MTNLLVESNPLIYGSSNDPSTALDVETKASLFRRVSILPEALVMLAEVLSRLSV